MMWKSLFNEMRLRRHQTRRTASGSVDDKVAVEADKASVTLEVVEGSDSESSVLDSVPLRRSETRDVAVILYGLAPRRASAALTKLKEARA